MTLGWGQLGTGLRGLHCQNGQQQGKAPPSGPALPASAPLGQLGPWAQVLDPVPQAPRRLGATLRLPHGPQSENRMWGCRCGSAVGGEERLANILFQALREPRGHLAAGLGGR